MAYLATLGSMPRPLPPRVAIVAVAIGGAIGAVGRHFLSDAFPDPSSGFPWTTFAINVIGSFALALLPALTSIREHHFWPPALGTGVLGGFTTMSTYAVQSRGLLAGHHVGLAAAYLIGTFAAALLAVALADEFSSRSERLEFEIEEGDL